MIKSPSNHLKNYKNMERAMRPGFMTSILARDALPLAYGRGAGLRAGRVR